MLAEKRHRQGESGRVVEYGVANELEEDMTKALLQGPVLRIPVTRVGKDTGMYSIETSARYLQLPVCRESFDAHKRGW